MAAKNTNLVFYPPQNKDNNIFSISKTDLTALPRNHVTRYYNVYDISTESVADEQVIKLRDDLYHVIEQNDMDGFSKCIEKYHELLELQTVIGLHDSQLTMNNTSILRHATIHGFEEAVLVLLELSDKEAILNDKHQGVGLLHDVVIKNMPCIIETISKILTQEEFHELMAIKATGIFYKEHFKGFELPLEIACWLGNKAIMKCLLLINPAGIYLKNSRGHNLLHSLILMCDEESEKVSNFVKEVFMMIYEAEGGKVTLEYLLDMKDNRELTPMLLALRKGEFPFVTLVLKTVLKRVTSEYGPARYIDYDITEIEQCPGVENKGLTGIMYVATTADACRLPGLFSLQPWDKILQLRWDMYKWYLLFTMLFHFGVLAYFAVNVAISPSKVELIVMNNSTLDQINGSDGVKFLLDRGYTGLHGLLQFGTECCFILYGLIGFIIQLGIMMRMGIGLKFKARLTMTEILSRMFNPATGSGLYGFTNLIFTFNIVLSYTSKLLLLPSSVFCISAATSIICGFIYLTFYYRTVPYTSFFTVTINRMIFGDVLQFLVISSGYLFGFGTAFYILFKGSQGGAPEDMKSFFNAIISTYKLMLGVADFKTMNISSGFYTVVFYILFTILMTVMLLNMLIGIMANTINDVSDHRKCYSKLQRLSTLMITEFGQFWSAGYTKRALERGDLKIRTVVYAGREQKRLFMECLEVDHEARFKYLPSKEKQF